MCLLYYMISCTVRFDYDPYGGFIKGILRGVRCTKLLRVLFLHRRPPSWTTLVLYSRAVFIFNEPALGHHISEIFQIQTDPGITRLFKFN
jgi:hypothetical protein